MKSRGRSILNKHNILKLIGYFLVLDLMFSPIIIFAATDSVVEMSKSTWFEQIKITAPSLICKSFIEDTDIALQMKNNNITYDNCLTLVPVISEKCVKQYKANLPMTITDEIADKWGKVIGECIGTNFAMQYLYQDN